MNKLFKAIFLISCIWLTDLECVAQSEFKPFISYIHKLKKEKGKYGLWNVQDKKWQLVPQYDSVTSSQFVNGRNNLVQCYSYNKYWKGGNFDLVYTITGEIVIDGIEDFFPFEGALPSHFQKNNIYHDYFNSSVFYKKDNHWGWSILLYKDRRLIRYYDSKPNFETLPTILTEFIFPDDYSLLLKPEYAILADSSNHKSIYSSNGRWRLPPGNYESFYFRRDKVYGDWLIYFKLYNGFEGALDPTSGNICPAKYISTEVITYPHELHLVGTLLNDDKEYWHVRSGKILSSSEVEVFKNKMNERERVDKHWKDYSDSMDKEFALALSNIIIYKGENGLGLRKKDGTLLLHPVPISININQICYYYTPTGIGCGKTGQYSPAIETSIKNPVYDTLHFNVPIEEVQGNRYLRIKFNDYTIKNLMLSEIYLDGKTQTKVCSICNGSGLVSYMEEQQVTPDQKTTVTKKCYSCGDIIVNSGGVSTSYTQTYTQTYTTSGKKEMVKKTHECVCKGTGKFTKGYKYDAERKIYIFY